MTKQTIHTLPVKGDKKSFNRFFITFYPRLTAYATLFLEPVAAEDVVQELFAYIWEHLDTLTIHTSLESYLFKAVYQRCLNQIKHQMTKGVQSRQFEEQIAEIERHALNPDQNEPVQQLFMSDLKRDMRQAIDGLPERCREVFMLSYIYQMKNREIAEVLDISINTVENHIAKALKILRVKLREYMPLLQLILSI